MPTARDRAPLPRRRLLPLTVLIAAAVPLLAFAGAAAAETKVGEASSPVNELINPEIDILNAKAEYDTSTGTVTLSATTRIPPTTSNPELILNAALFTSSKPCSVSATQEPSFPAFSILAHYDDPIGGWLLFGDAGEPSDTGPAATEINGGTITTSATTAKAAGRPYDCAVVTTNENTRETLDAVAFPIAVAQQPAVTVTTTPTTSQSAPASTPAPAPALSLAKLKPLKLKVGKWATVKVKVTNSGGTPTAPGSLQLKATKGVVVKPARQKLPVLLPGGSRTVSYKVKLTAKAKKGSTLALVGPAGTVTAKSSLVLKLAG
jgi:hypothetical protein